jgi:hypothetical protein
MITAGILTLVIPTGAYNRLLQADREIIDNKIEVTVQVLDKEGEVVGVVGGHSLPNNTHSSLSPVCRLNSYK